MKVLQLTNKSILSVVVNEYLPLGTTTIKYPDNASCGCEVFTVTSSTSDTIVVHRGGTYRLDYNLTATAAAAGEVSIEVVVGGESVYSVSATAAEGGTVNLTIPLDIYLPCNCNLSPYSIPAYIQLKNAGVALTSGTSNLLITRY